MEEDIYIVLIGTKSNKLMNKYNYVWTIMKIYTVYNYYRYRKIDRCFPTRVVTGFLTFTKSNLYTNHSLLAVICKNPKCNLFILLFQQLIYSIQII